MHDESITTSTVAFFPNLTYVDLLRNFKLGYPEKSENVSTANIDFPVLAYLLECYEYFHKSDPTSDF